MMTTMSLAAVNPNRIIEIGYSGNNASMMAQIDNNNGGIAQVIRQLTSLLSAAGLGIGVCVGLIYAIMWITSTPAKKADLKEKAFPLVIGVVLLFGGTTLAPYFMSMVAGILQ